MRRPDERHVHAVRALLAEARVENSRMVAAAIGGHLSRIVRRSGEVRDLDAASDIVRDASLHLLKALHQGADVSRARAAALESVERLEAALPDPAAMKPLSPREPAGRVRIRALAARKLSAVLPLWR